MKRWHDCVARRRAIGDEPWRCCGAWSAAAGRLDSLKSKLLLAWYAIVVVIDHRTQPSNTYKL
jgi:hypothetical protein